MRNQQANQPIKSTPEFGRTFDAIVLVAVIVAMCSQLNLRAIGRDTLTSDNFATKQLFIALSDVLLLLGFAWFFLRTTIVRAWHKIWIPPLPCWALIFALILSALHSKEIWGGVALAMESRPGLEGAIKSLLAAKESKEAIAEILQYVAYFLAATTLFVNLIYDRRQNEIIDRRKLAFHAFAGVIALNVLVALVQRFAAGTGLVGLLERLGIGVGNDAPVGLFGSPNIYAAFLAFALPLLLAQVLNRWRDVMPALIVTLICFAGALLTIVSAPAAIALLIGLLIAGMTLRRMPRAALVLVVALPCLLLWRAPSPLQQARAQSWQVPSETQQVKKQVIEWWAALGWSGIGSRALATGVGPGNYQNNIGQFYVRLPNEEKMPPDSNNLYLVQAVSIGVFGLGTLLWMFGHFGALALGAWKENRNDWLGAGVWASLCALALVSFFHATIVRGSGIVLAFLFSLAVVAAQNNLGIKENDDEKFDEERDGADLPAGAEPARDGR